jgi:hypothetical protein
MRHLAGWTFTSVDARVWLTEEHGGRDIWLLPGGRHVISGTGSVVLESWPIAGARSDVPARMRLTPPARAGGVRLQPLVTLGNNAMACA